MAPLRLLPPILGLLLAGVMVGCDIGFSEPDSQDRGFPLDDCTISADRLVDGGVGVDGIPALSSPSLVAPDAPQADYLADSSRVIGLQIDGTALAVPHNILWHHEIANLEMGGQRIAVTYCPLTGSSLAFSREAVDGAELGVSGLLLDNNLVMYDRRTNESLWPQMSRVAACGPATGTSLEMVPVVEMRWDRWRALYPETRVVSSETGFSRTYSPAGYPYGNYEVPSNDRLLFEGTPIDRRRPPKERVLALPAGSDRGLALPFGALDQEAPVRVVDVTVDGQDRVVFWSRAAGGAMAFQTDAAFTVRNGQIVDEATGSVWAVDGRAVEGPRQGERLVPVENAYVAFWFAWAAFHPNTDLWTPSSTS